MSEQKVLQCFYFHGVAGWCWCSLSNSDKQSFLLEQKERCLETTPALLKRTYIPRLAPTSLSLTAHKAKQKSFQRTDTDHAPQSIVQDNMCRPRLWCDEDLESLSSTCSSSGNFSGLSASDSYQGGVTFCGALTAELATQKRPQPSAKPHREASEDFQTTPATEQARVDVAPAPRTPLPWRSRDHIQHKLRNTLCTRAPQRRRRPPPWEKWFCLGCKRNLPQGHQGCSGTKILEAFDMNCKYGPCIGITRRARWERAKKFDLDPPAEVWELLFGSNSEAALQTSIWERRI